MQYQWQLIELMTWLIFFQRLSLCILWQLLSESLNLCRKLQKIWILDQGCAPWSKEFGVLLVDVIQSPSSPRVCKLIAFVWGTVFGWLSGSCWLIRGMSLLVKTNKQKIESVILKSRAWPSRVMNSIRKHFRKKNFLIPSHDIFWILNCVTLLDNEKLRLKWNKHIFGLHIDNSHTHVQQDFLFLREKTRFLMYKVTHSLFYFILLYFMVLF